MQKVEKSLIELIKSNALQQRSKSLSHNNNNNNNNNNNIGLNFH